MHPALTIIEEIYAMALNPQEDYYAQLEPLAQSGELANKIHTTKLLLKLCMIVDAQAKEIEALQPPKVDPSKPLT